MENKELESVIETSWESRDKINEKTVGKTLLQKQIDKKR